MRGEDAAGGPAGWRAYVAAEHPTDWGTERSLCFFEINGECGKGRKQPFRKEREETVGTQGGERRGKEWGVTRKGAHIPRGF